MTESEQVRILREALEELDGMGSGARDKSTLMRWVSAKVRAALAATAEPAWPHCPACQSPLHAATLESHRPFCSAEPATRDEAAPSREDVRRAQAQADSTQPLRAPAAQAEG